MGLSILTPMHGSCHSSDTLTNLHGAWYFVPHVFMQCVRGMMGVLN